MYAVTCSTLNGDSYIGPFSFFEATYSAEVHTDNIGMSRCLISTTPRVGSHAGPVRCLSQCPMAHVHGIPWDVSEVPVPVSHGTCGNVHGPVRCLSHTVKNGVFKNTHTGMSMDQ